MCAGNTTGDIVSSGLTCVQPLLVNLRGETFKWFDRFSDAAYACLAFVAKTAYGSTAQWVQPLLVSFRGETCKWFDQHSLTNSGPQTRREITALPSQTQARRSASKSLLMIVNWIMFNQVSAGQPGRQSLVRSNYLNLFCVTLLKQRF
jgi:hypothetical protein